MKSQNIDMNEIYFLSQSAGSFRLETITEQNVGLQPNLY